MIPRARLMPAAVALATLLAMLLAITLAGCGPSTSDEVVLTGRAVLPADTVTDGPPVGAAIEGQYNGCWMPLPSPPVQGFSSLVHLGGRSWAALQDNGFGSLTNSPDYPLFVFQIGLDLDAGVVNGVVAIPLTDPEGKLGFPLVNDMDEGLLHGADLDPESMVRLDDGTFWIGEEFGPFLVHVNLMGAVMEAAVPVPVPEPLRDHARGLTTYHSPDHPALRAMREEERLTTANLPRSGGIEGLARTPDGTRLIAAVEKALVDDPVRDRRTLLEFDPASGAFTGRHWFHRMDGPDLSIASLEAWSDTVLLITERDEAEGAEAEIKRIYRLDLTAVDAHGFVAKSLVCDLLDIADPEGVTAAEPGAIGLGPDFAFPFVTPECLVILDAHTLLVANDNNFPFSNGRRPGKPDDNEFIRLVLPQPLTGPVR